MLKPQPRLSALAPYTLARTELPDGVSQIALNQNESAFPPSPRAVEAGAEALRDARFYPDPEVPRLRNAIAEEYGIDWEDIVCGAGSMDLIATLVTCFAGPGDVVLSSDYGYAFFRTAAGIAGAQYVTAPENDFQVSVEALIDAVDGHTRVVLVANPGNPTGTRISRADLVRLRDALPDHILLVIDEAYGEFRDVPAERTFDLVARGNTVVLRTFSKAYGLAGMRVGWGLVPPQVQAEMRKLMAPNNIGCAAQAAAEAAVRDQAYMRMVVRETTDRRNRFAARLRTIGLSVPPCETNFVLIRFADADAAHSADAALRVRGVVLRPMGGFGLPNCLRATIGAEDDMTTTGDILTAWFEKEMAA